MELASSFTYKRDTEICEFSHQMLRQREGYAARWGELFRSDVLVMDSADPDRIENAPNVALAMVE